jgi:PKHD-type hydroxylase
MFETKYWYWSGVLSEELCDAIVLESDKLLFGEGFTGGQGEYSHYNVNIRNTNVSFFNKFHWIEGICLNYASFANINAGWNFDITYPQNVQYAKYFPDQHYTPHTDDFFGKNQNEMRKLSVAIQISDPNNYEGGDFIIEGPENNGEFVSINDFRKRGSVIVFPSVIKHGITPVIRGVRHSVVCWVVGPKFR